MYSVFIKSWWVAILLAAHISFAADTAPLTDVRIKSSDESTYIGFTSDRLKVDCSQFGAPWSQNITQFGSASVVTGTGNGGSGIPRVTVSNDSSITNISGTISLPTGASTSANQSTIITSLGTIDTDIKATQPRNITQFGGTNISTGTGNGGAGIPRFTMSNDSNLNNISGIISLPTGAATAANQATEITSLATIDTDIKASEPRKLQDGSGNAITSESLGGKRPLHNAIIGGTDGTTIGNTGDRLKVDATLGNSVITRTDVSTTVSANGDSGWLDTASYAELNWTTTVSALSGSGATFYVILEASDDQVNATSVYTTTKFTATGSQRFQGIREAGRYYRYRWVVAGTTPSITFTVITTLKPYSPLKSLLVINYADIDLQTNSNVSSTFTAGSCVNTSLMMVRGADGGNNASVQAQISNDSQNWDFIGSALSGVAPSSTNTLSFSAYSFRYWRLIVTGHTSAGTRTLDLYWSCNGG